MTRQDLLRLYRTNPLLDKLIMLESTKFRELDAKFNKAVSLLSALLDTSCRNAGNRMPAEWREAIDAAKAFLETQSN